MQALVENLALLKPKLEPFVLATLDIHWADKEKPIVTAFTHYLTNLLTAQTFYTKQPKILKIAMNQAVH